MRSFLVLVMASLVGSTFAQTCVPPVPSKIVSYPSGTIIDGVGTTDLPITTGNEQCRKLTQQGFALIHCFWFNEAVRSFRDATKVDPTCAIAWCGLYISETLPWNNNGDFRPEATYAVKRAVALCGNSTEVEQALIAACRARDLTEDDRNGAFGKAMEALITKFKDIDEPRLIMAGIRSQICMFDRTLSDGQVQNELKEVAKLIAPVLAKSPRNPGANHYQIHAYEGSTPEKALQSAKILGEIAPASAHMVHMPGHLYNVLGMWEEANASFGRANEIGEEYAKKLGVKPNEADWNYGHNRDYWGVSLGEEGRIKEAFKLITFEGRRNEIRCRVSDWKALQKAVADSGDNDEAVYYQGLSAAYLGEIDKATPLLNKLIAATEDTDGRIGKLVLRTRKLELRGLVACKTGDTAKGIDLLRQAVASFALIEYEEPPYYLRPPHETLGDMLIEAGRTEEAIAAFNDGLKVKRNGGSMLYGIARAHEKAGQTEKATAAYTKFLEVWAKADDDLEQVAHAKAFLALAKK